MEEYFRKYCASTTRRNDHHSISEEGNIVPDIPFLMMGAGALSVSYTACDVFGIMSSPETHHQHKEQHQARSNRHCKKIMSSIKPWQHRRFSADYPPSSSKRQRRQ
jgi:hypothetical protein